MSESFFDELKRRKVVRVAFAYGAVAFVVLQVADILFPPLGVPEWGFLLLVIAALVGFPVSLALAWVFDVTPEGVRRTGAPGQRGRIVAGRRAVVLRGGATALILVLAALAVVWMRPGTATGHVAPGAEVIAVLPFTTTGQNVEVLGEGMVDLLSRNLDQLGAIRTIDSRAILYRWQQRSREGRLPPEAAYALGRDVGAGSILWGNVLEVSGTVQMWAELRDVAGDLLAEAEVEGPSESVLALVDSLSVALLRSIWLSRDRPLPGIDLRTITTGDLDAIRDFLDGERFYRASNWDSAATSFGRAIAHDSAFALAYMRLAATLGWGGGTQEREQLEEFAAARALTLIDRLPTRAQTLVRALDLWVRGPQSASLDTLAAMVERYPDDVDALYTFADVRYHLEFEHEGLRRPPPRDGLADFDRVLEMDPSFAPAYIHPLEVSFLAADTALIRRFHNGLRLDAQVDSLTLDTYSRALRVLAGTDDIETVADAFRLAFRGSDAGLGTMAWQASRAVLTPLIRHAARLDSPRRGQLYDQLVAQRTTETLGRAERETRLLVEAGLLSVGGQLEAARQLIVRARTDGALTASNEQFATRMKVYGGFAQPAALASFFPDDNIVRQLAGIIAALNAGDMTTAEALADRIAPAATTGAGDDAARAEIAELTRAFVLAEAEPTPEHVATIARILSARQFQGTPYSEPFWFRWLQLLSEVPETRTQAITILEQPWRGDPIYEGPRIYALARALELDGQNQRARAMYERFLAMLADADPDLPIQQRIQAARQALARIE